MCSRTSSGSYGENREDDDYSVLCPKKQKHSNNGRRKVPRRGPGVAELEKIRLEEQQHNHSNVVQLPLPPPPTPEKPLTTIDRTGPVYPFSPFFTPGNFPNDLIPPAPVFQRTHDSSLHYLPPMSLPNPGSGGFYQFIEPPSSQTSISCLENVPQFLDDEKIVAAKRPWHFIAEPTKCSVGPTITISRDGKQIKSLDLRLKNHFQDSGTTIRNPITIDSPSTQMIPNTPLSFPRFIQEEEFAHEFMPRKSSANHLQNKKPFYSFLPSNEQSNCDHNRSKTERYDTGTDHGLDLRLKL